MRSWAEAQENVCEEVTIGFGLTFDWLRKLLVIAQRLAMHACAL